MKNIFKKSGSAESYASGAKKGGRFLSVIAILVIAAVLVSNAVVVIPSGYTGVVTTFGQIQPTPMPNGFNWKIPFVQNVQQVNNKQQDISISERIWSEASDQTVVYLEGVNITFQISPEKSAWIYANVSNYTENLLSASLVSSAMKMATKTLPTEDVTNRSIVEPVARETLQEQLDEKYGADTVRIIKVIINNIDFEDAYNAAIEARQLAKMEQERQEIENATNLEKAEAEAQAARIRAQGQADANAILTQSITNATQMQDVIEAWDGKLPSTLVTDGSSIFHMFSIGADESGLGIAQIPSTLSDAGSSAAGGAQYSAQDDVSGGTQDDIPDDTLDDGQDSSAE